MSGIDHPEGGGDIVFLRQRASSLSDLTQAGVTDGLVTTAACQSSQSHQSHQGISQDSIVPANPAGGNRSAGGWTGRRYEGRRARSSDTLEALGIGGPTTLGAAAAAGVRGRGGLGVGSLNLPPSMLRDASLTDGAAAMLLGLDDHRSPAAGRFEAAGNGNRDKQKDASNASTGLGVFAGEPELREEADENDGSDGWASTDGDSQSGYSSAGGASGRWGPFSSPAGYYASGMTTDSGTQFMSRFGRGSKAPAAGFSLGLPAVDGAMDGAGDMGDETGHGGAAVGWRPSNGAASGPPSDMQWQMGGEAAASVGASSGPWVRAGAAIGAGIEHLHHGSDSAPGSPVSGLEWAGSAAGAGSDPGSRSPDSASHSADGSRRHVEPPVISPGMPLREQLLRQGQPADGLVEAFGAAAGGRCSPSSASGRAEEPPLPLQPAEQGSSKGGQPLGSDTTQFPGPSGLSIARPGLQPEDGRKHGGMAGLAGGSALTPLIREEDDEDDDGGEGGGKRKGWIALGGSGVARAKSSGGSSIGRSSSASDAVTPGPRRQLSGESGGKSPAGSPLGVKITGGETRPSTGFGDDSGPVSSDSVPGRSGDSPGVSGRCDPISPTLARGSHSAGGDTRRWEGSRGPHKRKVPKDRGSKGSKRKPDRKAKAEREAGRRRGKAGSDEGDELDHVNEPDLAMQESMKLPSGRGRPKKGGKYYPRSWTEKVPAYWAQFDVTKGLAATDVDSLALAVATPLACEVEEGGTEYKLKLAPTTRERYMQLVTQMRWRLEEGEGRAAYQVGYEDGGHPRGIKERLMKTSLAVLDHMATENNADIFVHKVFRGVGVRRRRRKGKGKRGSAAAAGAPDALGKPSAVAQQSRGSSASKVPLFTCEVGVRLREEVESRDEVQEMRVAVVGEEGSGKSTLIAVLTQGGLDDGDGLKRLEVFRHGHEFEDGRTSSVSTQMFGFSAAPPAAPTGEKTSDSAAASIAAALGGGVDPTDSQAKTDEADDSGVMAGLSDSDEEAGDGGFGDLLGGSDGGMGEGDGGFGDLLEGSDGGSARASACRKPLHAAPPGGYGPGGLAPIVSGSVDTLDGVPLSWKEIVKQSKRAILFLDTAGAERYAKTTMMGLLGHDPSYCMLVVDAAKGLTRVAKEYLGIAIALRLLPFVVLNKVDGAAAEPAAIARRVREIESVLQQHKSHRHVVVVDDTGDGVAAAAVEKVTAPDSGAGTLPKVDGTKGAVTAALALGGQQRVVPVVLTSCVTGRGIRAMYAFLASIPRPSPPTRIRRAPSLGSLHEVFYVTEAGGLVVSGVLHAGSVHAGDVLLLGPDGLGAFRPVRCVSLQSLRLPVRRVTTGQSASFALVKASVAELPSFYRGMAKGILIKEDSATAAAALAGSSDVPAVPATVADGEPTGSTPASGASAEGTSEAGAEAIVAAGVPPGRSDASAIPEDAIRAAAEFSGALPLPRTAFRRGMVLVSPWLRPTASRTFSVQLLLLQHPSRLRVGAVVMLHVRTLRRPARVDAILPAAGGAAVGGVIEGEKGGGRRSGARSGRGEGRWDRGRWVPAGVDDGGVVVGGGGGRGRRRIPRRASDGDQLSGLAAGAAASAEAMALLSAGAPRPQDSGVDHDAHDDGRKAVDEADEVVAESAGAGETGVEEGGGDSKSGLSGSGDGRGRRQGHRERRQERRESRRRRRQSGQSGEATLPWVMALAGEGRASMGGGDTREVVFSFRNHAEFITPGAPVLLREGAIRGIGRITRVFGHGFGAGS